MAFVRDWQYGFASWNKIGVTLETDRLVWWESGEGSIGGGACYQSFESFLKHGPEYRDTPAEVVAEVRQAVLELMARRPGKRR